MVAGDISYGLMISSAGVETRPVPLNEVSISVRIIDSVAEVCIEHHYVNQEDQAIDTVYKFPLDDKSAVCGFSAEIGDRRIEGVVRETEDEDEYDEAVQSGHAAFFLQETLPDVFKAKVGRLSPGSGARIRVVYVTELKVENGEIRFDLPASVFPHYGSPARTASVTNPTEKTSRLQFEAQVQMSSEITAVHSPTHRLVVSSDQPHLSRVRLADVIGSAASQPLVLYIQRSNPHQPHLIFEKSETGSTALMFNLVPWCSLRAAEQKAELIFVTDRSGSMEGAGIQLAARALKLFLHSLPVDCFVNIVGFGFNHQPLFPSSRKYDDQVLSEALAYAEAMEANMGGTEIYGPLEWIFQQPSIPGYLRQVFLLTDGEVSDEDQVISLVRRYNSRARVFAIGLGNSASRQLVERVARGGNGSALFASLEEPLGLQSKVIQQLESALQPAVTDVSLQWQGYETRVQGDVKLRQIPAKCPPVFDGHHLVTYALLQEKMPLPDSVTLNALSPVGSMSIKVSLNQNNFAIGQLVHRLAVKKLIRELQDVEATDDVMKEIIDLGCRYGLASRYTSFAAVDPKDPDVSLRESWMMIKSRDVPNTMAFGCNMAAAPMINNNHFSSSQCNGPILDEKGRQQVVSPNDKLMELMSSQSFDGCFQKDELLAELLNSTAGDISGAGRNMGYSKPVWTTLLALAFLSVALPELRSSWQLLANKSLKWLRSQSLADEVKTKLDAEAFIKLKLNI